MGERFNLKVYNHSESAVEFEISNAGCMHLPRGTRISVPAYGWGSFDTIETSNNVFNFCRVAASLLTISARRGKIELSKSTYDICSRERELYFYSFIAGTFSDAPQGMKVTAKSPFSAPPYGKLQFKREASRSYGDLFFNGRGLYVDDAIKSEMHGYGMAETSGEIDDMPPTLLVNSNNQFAKEVDDDSLLQIVPRVFDLGLKLGEIYSVAKTFTKTDPAVDKKDLAEVAEAAGEKGKLRELWDKGVALADKSWPLTKETMLAYFGAYKGVVAAHDEITVHVHHLDNAPTFHLVFTDSIARAPEIMNGAFHLPSPGSDNSFHRNILHLSKEAAEALNRPEVA